MEMKKKRQKKKSKTWAKIKAMYNKVGTLNIVLILVGIFFLRFNYRMIEVYVLCGSIPETYACAVIAATIGECGICGWIRTNKDRKREQKENNEGGKG